MLGLTRNVGGTKASSKVGNKLTQQTAMLGISDALRHADQLVKGLVGATINGFVALLYGSSTGRNVGSGLLGGGRSGLWCLGTISKFTSS